MYEHLNPDLLTPGVLDAPAIEAFSRGACGALALAIHRSTNWPIVAITDHQNVFEDGKAGGGSALHWVVQRPDGLLIDVNGAHLINDLIEAYDGDADDGIAAAGISTEADIVEWYINNQDEPIPIDLADTFVDAVLRNAK